GRAPRLALAGPPAPAVPAGAGDGRSRGSSVPFTDTRGRRERLTLTASLEEAERITQAERTALLRVTIGAALFLSLMLWAVVSRMLVSRVRVLENSMRAVQEGNLETQVPVDAQGGDELTFLARGFNRMIAQIRGFNAELTRKIDDATARLKATNEQLVIMQRDLTAKERLAALGQLGGTIAHELGNPLNALSGHVQLMARRPDLPEPIKDKLTIVNGEVQRMTQIIRRFLDQTRGFTPAVENARLKALVDEALDLTIGQEQRGKLQLVAQVEPDAERVRTDAGLVRHLLVNLVANAVDAMPGGGSLTVRGRRDGGELVLSVADSGAGMPPEVRKHIFEPFFTTKPTGKGTGLGLSICKEIARAFKGRIDVESEVGKGTVFTVRFPAEPWQEAA
ncbi:MAG: HAMP domain-containing protein, partial [Deltaproteobacteria bacterium]|nr:HAMP domain-containing protein [Deltaproteobacteria bacterium]